MTNQKQPDKVIIVPDVHGRTFWRTVLDNREDRIVFLGDYSDPYAYEGLTHKDALREFNDIIDLKKANPERITLLLGNHDLHYIDNQFACSRYSYQNHYLYEDLIVNNIGLFQAVSGYEQNGQKYLFTHAGISKGWLDRNSNNLVKCDSIIDSLNRTFAVKPELWFQISPLRGGEDDYGSPIWADIEEHDAIGALPDTIQIFGHTQMEKDPYVNGNMWCVDCRKAYALEKGELRELIP